MIALSINACMIYFDGASNDKCLACVFVCVFVCMCAGMCFFAHIFLCVCIFQKMHDHALVCLSITIGACMCMMAVCVQGLIRG